MLEEIVNGFMASEFDGRCPVCGGFAEADSSDEGFERVVKPIVKNTHWFERYWHCEKCGTWFTEQFTMVPEWIFIDED